MDYLITYKEHPELFIFFIVSYLSYFKVPLMKLTTFEEHESFLHHLNPVKIGILQNFIF